MIKGNITFIICILLLQITLPLIIQAQESKTNKLAQEPISRYLQLPPHLTFVLSCIEKENDSSSLRGRVGFQFSGNSLPSESFFIGWRNAMLFEKSTKDVYGFYSGVYGNVEEMYGIQISTLNESLKMEGVQIAIFANLSNAGNGVQISAIMNSASNWNGIQLSLGGNQILSRYYERRKSLRVKSHERSFSKNDEDDCRNPNGALPRPPGFFKAWKHPEEVGKRKSRSTMLRLLRSVAWIFLEWLRPRIAILRFPKQDKVHSFISKSKRGLPSVATWSKLATNFNELDAQNNQEANHE